MATTGAAENNNNYKVTFKNCTPFTSCISKTKNTQVDKTKDINIVMSIYNLIEYIGNYLKISGS